MFEYFAGFVAGLIKKIKDGRPYWYVVESARVNGKPRFVNQRFLGTVDSNERGKRVVLVDEAHLLPAELLQHHLKLAGRSDPLFADSAVALIQQISRGIPSSK